MRIERAIARSGPFPILLTLLLSACDSTGPALSNARLPDSVNVDSIVPPAVPQDSLPGDSTSPPGTDSVVPPPDSVGPIDPPVVVTHVGIPFGPFALPSRLYGPKFSGAYIPPRGQPLLAELEAARRASTRVLLNFTGAGQYFSDDAGFNLARWKQRVDRFRGIDLTSYIADGTILGHFLMDEPNDASNWNGDRVSPAEVDEMAKYSKEIWPTMSTIIRGWPAYLKGYEFKYLDAAWAQYHVRFGSVDDFIATNVSDAKASGLALVAGLNVLNGGSSSSGIPGTRVGKYGMSASELRSWGGALLSEPYMCALIIWKYNEEYFSRPDIEAALSDLNDRAATHSKQACRRGT